MTVPLMRWLHLGHRWLGIGLGLMVLLWFVSGVVMLFVARPQLTDGERLAALPPLAAERVRVSPLAAWQALGLPGWPQVVRLNTAGGRPAYHFLTGAGWASVDADDGSPRAAMTAALAAQIALAQAGDRSVAAVTLIERDQWTLYRRFDAWRPLLRVELADGRDYYVSARNGEVVLDTAPAERAWNWVGSVIHWLYFTPLRQHTALWRNLMLWGSFAALLLAGSGLWLGWQRLRWRQRYADGRTTPYRGAWKRWHHLLGLGGGLFVLTWLLSGWLSLAPLGLAAGVGASAEEQRRLAGGELDAEALAWRPAIGPATREVEWLRFAGQPLARLTDGGAASVLVDRNGSQRREIALAEIAQAAASLRPGLALQADWLIRPDDRYYPLRHHPRSFPVARLSFADAQHSVFYVAPDSGRIALYADRHDLAQRWLFQALHRLDFAALVAHPALRDGLIVALSLLGGALSLTGCVLGWRRLSRGRGRPGAAPAPGADAIVIDSETVNAARRVGPRQIGRPTHHR